jgi:hypothetical protein
MGRVRAFEERDIPQVVALHRRVFSLPDGGATDRVDAYHAYFKETFLSAPWSDGHPSLVYEDGEGEPIGFLGVMTREMKLGDRPIRLVTSSQFIVEPTRRATLAGIELLRTLLAGPQDVTLADEASDVSRKLWEKLGGTTDLLWSLYWARLFRPVEFAAQRWRKDPRKPAASARTFLCRLVDAVVTRWPGAPFRAPASETSGEDLDGEKLAACISALAGHRALRPAYTGQTAAWLLEFLSRKLGCGTLRKVLVRTKAREVAGWYLYCGRRDGVGEVLQIGAQDERVGDVLDHLFAQAWRHGAVAIIGRVDPYFVPALAARNCFFHYRGHWTLVHARNPQVLQAIQRGDAFLTRLEGEWCMRFQAGYA